MKKYIKSFKSNWNDIYLGGMTVDKKNEYLSQFRKPYSERTKSENILVESLYYIEFVGSTDNRFLGAMESILILNDQLKVGTPFDYKEKEYKFLFMSFKSKETYKEIITRLSKEFLLKNDVL